MVALIGFFIGVQPLAAGGSESGLVEVVCSSWVLLSFIPFLKGVFKEAMGFPGQPNAKQGPWHFSSCTCVQGQMDFFRVERSSATIVHCNNQ